MTTIFQKSIQASMTKNAPVKRKVAKYAPVWIGDIVTYMLADGTVCRARVEDANDELSHSQSRIVVKPLTGGKGRSIKIGSLMTVKKSWRDAVQTVDELKKECGIVDTVS